MATATSSTRYHLTKVPSFTPQEKGIIFLPGNNFHDDPVVRGSHNKVHHLGMIAGVPSVVAPIGATFVPPDYKKLTSVEDKLRECTPPWLIACNVLRFNVFFKESVVESAIETVRVRKCVLLFHTEDKTVQVREAAILNSGMPHGALIKRHRVPLENSKNDQESNVADHRFVDLEDLQIGNEIQLYGKLFTIVSCDAETRYHMEAIGMPQLPNQEFPVDDDHFGLYVASKKATQKRDPTFTDTELKRYHENGATGRISKPTVGEVVSAQQFFKFGGQSLQFFAIWDDRDSSYGDARKLQLNFHLEDDTLEVLEGHVGPEAAGRDHSTKFMVRQRIPVADQEGKPNFATSFANRSAFDTLGKQSSQQLTFGIKMEREYLKAEDFAVGKTLRVNGKDLFIYDCSPFTRKFFLEELGISLQPGVDPNAQFNLSQKKAPRLRPPPHDGIGSEEDTLSNWRTLLLQSSTASMIANHEKWNQNKGKILTFALRMLRSPNAVIEEDGRHFVLSFYLEDDTLQISEINIKNSGLLGGKYLARQKVKRVLPSGEVLFYKAEDFRIGAIVSIFGKLFEILEMDIRTKKIVNSFEDETPSEEIKRLVILIKEVLGMRFHRLQEAFIVVSNGGKSGSSGGCIDLDNLIAFYKTMNVDIKIQDAKTILDMYDKNRSGKLEYEEFIGLMEGDSQSANIDDLALSTRSVKLHQSMQFTREMLFKRTE